MRTISSLLAFAKVSIHTTRAIYKAVQSTLGFHTLRI